MTSSTTDSFRRQFSALPIGVQNLAKKQFRLWRDNHFHPSIHFKKVNAYWSARVDRDHRVLGLEENGHIIWFFIGRHGRYERRH